MIGFYDSGLGGLTILTEMLEISPATALVYYGDTKNCPLGNKSPEKIEEAVKKGVEFLFDHGCSVVVLACNTATVTSIRSLQGKWMDKYKGRNILGVARPVAEYLTEGEVEKTDHLAVLATEVTVKSNFYQEELNAAGYNNITQIACSGLAIAIENQDEELQRKLLSEYFANVDTSKINHLVLACTHYPIIKKIILEEFVKSGGNKNAKIISQSDIVPEKLIDYLVRHPEYELDGQGVEIFVTQDPDLFEQRVFSIFDIKTKVTEI
jgi:glutamate racemase